MMIEIIRYFTLRHQLEDKIAILCEFANESNPQGEFLHPVARSIILHFMIAYDHPFVDGNGRTARALYYWSMAKYGYWMMEYVSISTILKNAPANYARAYLYTENDDNDTTYFLDLNLRVILRAVKKLQDYLAKKTSEVKNVEAILSLTTVRNSLNHRQLAVISHALSHPKHSYSFESHRNSHRITYPTARTDLLTLVDIGLLSKLKIGNTFYFTAFEDIASRLKNIGTSKD